MDRERSWFLAGSGGICSACVMGGLGSIGQSWLTIHGIESWIGRLLPCSLFAFALIYGTTLWSPYTTRLARLWILFAGLLGFLVLDYEWARLYDDAATKGAFVVGSLVGYVGSGDPESTALRVARWCLVVPAACAVVSMFSQEFTGLAGVWTFPTSNLPLTDPASIVLPMIALTLTAGLFAPWNKPLVAFFVVLPFLFAMVFCASDTAFPFRIARTFVYCFLSILAGIGMTAFVDWAQGTKTITGKKPVIAEK